MSYTLEELAAHHEATGSVVSRYVPESDYSKLQQERNELAATVEALRNLLPPKVIDLIRCGIGGNYGGDCFVEAMQKLHEPLVIALATTPQQHLRDVRAEAGRAGFIAGLRLRSKGVCLDFEAAADNYAESVRAGEK